MLQLTSYKIFEKGVCRRALAFGKARRKNLNLRSMGCCRVNNMTR